MYLGRFTFTELFVGRHAESMANLASIRAHEGDETLIEELRHLHTKDVPLSTKGVQQSIRKGAWFTDQAPHLFDFYVTSEYLRAIQTGLYMALPGSVWTRDARLNERNWGPMDQISSRERTVRWPTWKRDKEANPYDWRPHDGETLREKQKSAYVALHELSEHFPGKRGVIVAHGETNLVIQASIEHILPDEFRAREAGLRMDNTDIIQYKQSGITGLFKRRISPARNAQSMWERVR